jgi:ATP-dependent RNA helicase DDX5/DBP2
VVVFSIKMTAAATTSSAGPRYAPDDPALPKPWRGLVDGKTGYLYFWNPETNVTQYERPSTSAIPPKSSSSVPITPSVQVEQSSSHRGYSPDDRYGRAHNAESKADAVTRSSQAWVVLLFYFVTVNSISLT